MIKPVVLSFNARDDLENISAELAEKWKLSLLDNFIFLYESAVKVISEYNSLPGKRRPYTNHQHF